MDTILFAVAFFYLTKFFGIFIVSVYRKVSGFCGKAPRPGRPILPLHANGGADPDAVINPAGQGVQLGSLQASRARNHWRPWARAPNNPSPTEPPPGGQGMPIKHLTTPSVTKTNRECSTH